MIKPSRNKKRRDKRGRTLKNMCEIIMSFTKGRCHKDVSVKEFIAFLEETEDVSIYSLWKKIVEEIDEIGSSDMTW